MQLDLLSYLKIWCHMWMLSNNTMTNCYIQFFLEDLEDNKKSFRNLLTFGAVTKWYIAYIFLLNFISFMTVALFSSSSLPRRPIDWGRKQIVSCKEVSESYQSCNFHNQQKKGAGLVRSSTAIHQSFFEDTISSLV